MTRIYLSQSPSRESEIRNQGLVHYCAGSCTGKVILKQNLSRGRVFCCVPYGKKKFSVNFRRKMQKIAVSTKWQCEILMLRLPGFMVKQRILA